MENTNIAVFNDDGMNLIADLTTPSTSAFCSLIPQTEDEEKILYNATMSPAKRVGDCINECINLRHVFCEIITVTNEETGEVSRVPRTVLIDDNGVGYQCVSTGIFNAIKKLFAVKGMPDAWVKPVTVKVQQITKGKRQILTLIMP